MKLNPIAIIDNLYYMCVGMASMLIVIAVLILATLCLNKLFTRQK